MRIKPILLTLFIAIYSINCQSQKIKRLAKKGIVKQSNYNSKIPFRYEKKHIFIDVSINGEIYNFLFDTGFTVNAIDLKYIKNVDYKNVVKKNVSGSSIKKHKVQFIEMQKLSISNIDFNEIGATIMDLSFINKDYACSSKPVAGVIGVNTLRKSNWQIDYQNQEILFSDNISNFNISDKAIEIKIIPKDWGNPIVDVDINGVSKKFTLDTGSSGNITTGNDFKGNLITNRINYISLTKKDKSNKNYNNYYALIEQIDIGDLKLNNHIISLEKGASSLIGNDLFEHFIITIDWINNKFFLEPINNPVGKTFRDFEILLKPNYSSNRIEISGFYNHKLLQKEYEIGTEIVKINEQDVSNLSKQQLCDFWENKWKKNSSREKVVIETENKKIELIKTKLLTK
jgi:predicted aspartyl protease|tara:strand:- start:110 stop:1309 length:1200 start_codon:yes stop_codon:yes gene_type:complete